MSSRLQTIKEAVLPADIRVKQGDTTDRVRIHSGAVFRLLKIVPGEMTHRNGLSLIRSRLRRQFGDELLEDGLLTVNKGSSFRTYEGQRYEAGYDRVFVFDDFAGLSFDAMRIKWFVHEIIANAQKPGQPIPTCIGKDLELQRLAEQYGLFIQPPQEGKKQPVWRGQRIISWAYPYQDPNRFVKEHGNVWLEQLLAHPGFIDLPRNVLLEVKGTEYSLEVVATQKETC